MRARFDQFEFDTCTGEIKQAGEQVPLQPQPGKVLALLVENAGELVDRASIQRHVWGEDTHVDFEQGLNWCIRRIREVLGDSTSNSRYVQTVPRRGYRFIAAVESVPVKNLVAEAPAFQKYRALALAGILVVLAVIGILFARDRAPHRHVTVLVLPFDDVSESQSGGRYQDIAADKLMAKLARINPSQLSVIDPMTARKFKNTKECIIEIGNRLGADYVLLGEVDPSSTTVKVDAQLFQVSTNRQVWAAEREIPRNGQFSPVWDEMGSAVGRELGQRVTIQ